MYAVIFLASLIIAYGHTLNASDLENTTQQYGTPSPVACVSARKLSGFCVKRGRCDYGPTNIDFTLYKTKGFIRPCSIENVCCPPQYITPDTASSNSNNMDESDEIKEFRLIDY
ncbi:uncharacterized protein LOC116776948 isoform X2 [Danaus plexippus]|uniref:uncharacterized protein LOC116776948 isoform X2 n=1 Tax=Danaus plexippus TaxID=13037 RepID=UPI002AB302A6|nr:uncharacterized protein LOC116776948 isoform X2 [Danaus plexippus]